MSQLHKTEGHASFRGCKQQQERGVCRGVSTHSDTVQRFTTEYLSSLYHQLNHVHVNSCKIDGGYGKIAAKIQKQKQKGQEVILRATKHVLEILT